MSKELETQTYFVKGFGLVNGCGHNAVVTWKMRTPVYFGQPVYDLTCECGATAVKMTYKAVARRQRR